MCVSLLENFGKKDFFLMFKKFSKYSLYYIGPLLQVIFEKNGKKIHPFFVKSKKSLKKWEFTKISKKLLKRRGMFKKEDGVYHIQYIQYMLQLISYSLELIAYNLQGYHDCCEKNFKIMIKYSITVIQYNLYYNYSY